MKFKKYLNEENNYKYVNNKIKIFIKNYKEKYPDYKVYKGPNIKEIISWNPMTILSVNNNKTVMKGNIINALYGKSEKEFLVLIFKRDDTKDIIVMGTDEPLPLEKKYIKLEEMAKGWDKSSIEKMGKTIGKSPADHGFFDACVLHMKKSMDNPEAYCADLIDNFKGNTDWRKGKRKK